MYLSINQIIKLKLNIMKNLFLTAAMLAFFGGAYAQDTPAKTKQSTTTSQSATTSDTIRKSNKGSNNANNSTYKTDTNNHSTDKKSNKTKSAAPVNNSRKDSVSGSSTRP